MDGGRVEPGRALTSRFQIQDSLGRGGLGELYRARSLDTGRMQAVRMTDIPDAPIVLDAMAEVIALHERFIDAPLAHIRVSGADEQRMWYAMDLLDGESVLTRVRSKGVLGPDNATELLTQVCDAVAVLHDANVVHQDLSPRNLFIDGETVKVLELGIAPALARVIREKPGIITTPRVRAAEQLVSAEASPRTDVYALGTILYYLVTGRKAIPEGGGVLQLATDGGVRPPTLDAVPDVLRPILTRALAMRPEARFPSARDLGAALSAAGVAT
jgi:serine/threonine protein kinase